MPLRVMRGALIAADGLAAATAIPGGIAILTRLDEFPPSWLRRAPFPDYRLPALLLSGVVGGSAALATAAMLRSPTTGGRVSVVAGVVMMGWIAAETRLLDYSEDPNDNDWIEPAYFALGALMAGLGVVVAAQSRK